MHGKHKKIVLQSLINPNPLIFHGYAKEYPGYPQNIELNPSTISYISDGLKSVNIPKILTVITCLLHCMHSNEQISWQSF